VIFNRQRPRSRWRNCSAKRPPTFRHANGQAALKSYTGYIHNPVLFCMQISLHSSTNTFRRWKRIRNPISWRKSAKRPSRKCGTRPKMRQRRVPSISAKGLSNQRRQRRDRSSRKSKRSLVLEKLVKNERPLRWLRRRRPQHRNLFCRNSRIKLANIMF